MSAEVNTVSSRRQTTLTTDPSKVSRRWIHVDAAGVPLGRLAAEVAQVLMGKHRPDYTPHVDTGEYVIITNASKIEMTGNKAAHNTRQHYTRYPGGLREETYGELRDRDPELLINDAVRRMMPKNRLSRVMLQKLNVFPGADHTFAAKKPVKMTIL
ncbi:50S ribosomal protein L13 [Phycisphaerae bacterium]|jgi:large subunit ribosomal protein L13|nr:50S ribosomal protein L13 [Phycisphaerae bacterium]